MSRLKKAGIIIAIAATVVFAILYFTMPHSLIGAVMVLFFGGMVIVGLMMVSAGEELEDTKDEK